MLALSVAELKALLISHGIGHSGCIEKVELQRLARACCQQSNASEASLSEVPLPVSNLSEEPPAASNAPEEPPFGLAQSNAPEETLGT